jgi:hypothetical protein
MELQELTAAFLKQVPVVCRIPNEPVLVFSRIKALRIRRNSKRFINSAVCEDKKRDDCDVIVPRRYLFPVEPLGNSAPELKIDKRIENAFKNRSEIRIKMDDGTSVVFPEITGLIIRIDENRNIETRVFVDSENYVEVPAKNVTVKRIDYQIYVKLYSEILPRFRQPQKLTEQRKKAIRGALSDKVDFQELFKKVAASDFLMNECKPCDFDWILKPSNRVKILEGRYDNVAPGSPTSEPPSYDISELEIID